MKKFNVVVSTLVSLLALAALLIFCCAKCVAGVGGTSLIEAGLLALIVTSSWASLWLATRPADEPIVMAVPCPRCGGAQFDRSICGDCIEAICWEQVSRSEAKGYEEADLSFEVWFEENEDSLMEEAEESGRNHELDFDFESWAEARFEKSNKNK